MRCCASACWLACYLQRRRTAAANQMALIPPISCAPLRPRPGIAWTIPWKAFGAQETDPPIMRRFGPNPNFESFWLLGQP